MAESEHLQLDNLEQLIGDCMSGRRPAQNRIYEIFAPRMLPVCLRYANDREEAEEILQEGFIKVFTHILQFRREGSFEGWVRRIIVNAALQRYREKARMFPVISLQEEMVVKASGNEAYANIGYKDLLELVQKLPPAYRLVFNLYVFEGMKHKEIAEALKISEGTSKSNLYDARLILQREIMKLDQVNTQKLACL
ncbi:MAG TPA: sigma-70 family RNA polymerase sigma factor [Chitinophagaceae bacterium]|jgi:RNA polymerase sigma-70 factor (ECF subfamily)|nr:sigma-70 family RNA polymerase sigma factor [Chitinophagaceae bacterium]